MHKNIKTKLSKRQIQSMALGAQLGLSSCPKRWPSLKVNFSDTNTSIEQGLN